MAAALMSSVNDPVLTPLLAMDLLELPRPAFLGLEPTDRVLEDVDMIEDTMELRLFTILKYVHKSGPILPGAF